MRTENWQRCDELHRNYDDGQWISYFIVSPEFGNCVENSLLSASSLLQQQQQHQKRPQQLRKWFIRLLDGQQYEPSKFYHFISKLILFCCVSRFWLLFIRHQSFPAMCIFHWIALRCKLLVVCCENANAVAWCRCPLPSTYLFIRSIRCRACFIQSHNNLKQLQ